jgi:D-3-phosphoglycerate dehydrogenase / 2-oxoglutarate reductase
MGVKKVIFLDAVHEVLEQRLSAAGFVCEHHYSSPRAEVLSILHAFAGIVVRSRLTIDRELFDSATQLEWIARSGSGLENIDLRTAEDRGIHVISSPEGNRDAVGEHVIGLTLAMLNQICTANTSVKDGHWLREAHRGRELKNLTFGIIGYGHMGSAVAEKLKGFGCRIVAYDKYKKGFGNQHVTEVALQQFYREADIVSLHLPQSADTYHYANEAFFGQFQKSIWFINTARGKNTHTAALLSALENGKVIGAALDVLEFEKASLEGLTDADSEILTRLKTLTQVLLTPHVAGWTTESYFKLSDVLADKILAQHQATR